MMDCKESHVDSNINETNEKVIELNIQRNESDDENDDDWDELEPNEPEATKCLFCDNDFTTIILALEHCLSNHNFNLFVLSEKHRMDIYSYIQLINYIRTNNSTAKQIMECNEPFWNDEKYLRPILCDQWLMFDFEDWLEKNSNNKLKKDFNTENIEDMKTQLQQFESQIVQQQEVIRRAMEDIEKMRETIQNLIENQDLKSTNSLTTSIAIDDDPYFTSYAHFDIHHQMLQDAVRTETYRDAILHNRDFFQNTRVLDVGCGTGILSMFLAQAGASNVIGVDQSTIIYQASDIIRENGFDEKIELIRNQIENVNLSDKVDAIVSEWMGYFLLYEGMLDSFIYARDHFLKENGKLLPNRCTLKIVGCSDTERHNELIGCWKNVYGFKMTCMITEATSEPNMEIIPEDKLLTNDFTILDLDLYTCVSSSASNFERNFTLNVQQDGVLTAIVGFFDTYFTSLPKQFQFSTGPTSKPTHWKQTVFYLREPIYFKKGETIEGVIKCCRRDTNLRNLVITIQVAGVKQEYIMS